MIAKRKTILSALLFLALFYLWGYIYYIVTDSISGEISWILMFPIDFLIGCFTAIIVGRILKADEYLFYGISFVVLFGIMVVLCMIGEKFGHSLEKHWWFRQNLWKYFPQLIAIIHMAFACFIHIAFLGVKYVLKKRHTEK